MVEVYRIEVLHIVNPYMIFIESQARENQSVFEQVGIYGVVPLHQILDIEDEDPEISNVDGRVLVERCEQWSEAATEIIWSALLGNTHRVYFVPLRCDERNSIFDGSVYKFGDIIIQPRHRNSVSITEHLINSLVAVKDEPIFLQNLSSGSLKLKLNMTQTDEVLNNIKKYYEKHGKEGFEWQDILDRQMVSHQKTKKMLTKLVKETSVLVQNSNPPDNVIKKVIEMKEKDLEFCKEADLIPIGRGTKHLSNPNSGTILQDSPKNIVNNVKLILDIYRRKKDSNNNGLQTSKIKDRNIYKQGMKNETSNMEPNSVEGDDDWDEVPEKYIPKSEPKLFEDGNKNIIVTAQELNIGQILMKTNQNPDLNNGPQNKNQLDNIREQEMFGNVNSNKIKLIMRLLSKE